jgi:hypothetical protein
VRSENFKCSYDGEQKIDLKKIASCSWCISITTVTFGLTCGSPGEDEDAIVGGGEDDDWTGTEEKR